MRFVLAIVVSALLVMGALAQPAAAPNLSERPHPYRAAERLTDLKDVFINESSGVAASRTNPGVLWTHNDSGDGAYLYAIDRQGRTKGVFLVRHAAASDWEDMAYGPGPDGKGHCLYLGDIGDNGRTRTDCVVYRIPEPKLQRSTGSKHTPLLSDEPTIRRSFAYPDGPHDAEALLVHPQTGILYIVTKDRGEGVAGVYRFGPEPKNWWQKNTLVKVGTVPLVGEISPQVTGGDIAPDGKRAVLCTYRAAYELALPADATDFDALWKTKPTPIALPAMPQCEAVCYAPDGKALYATSEQVPTPLYELAAK